MFCTIKITFLSNPNQLQNPISPDKILDTRIHEYAKYKIILLVYVTTSELFTEKYNILKLVLAGFQFYIMLIYNIFCFFIFYLIYLVFAGVSVKIYSYFSIKDNFFLKKIDLV